MTLSAVLTPATEGGFVALNPETGTATQGESVEEALAKLKEPEREVIVLKFMTGLTLQETANVMGVKLSAAKMRLYRALESFKEAYSRLDNAPPLPNFPNSDD